MAEWSNTPHVKGVAEVRSKNQKTELREKAIHDALAKVSWKLLKRELDKVAWHNQPLELLNVMMRADGLLNRRENNDKARRRAELFSELFAYVQGKLSPIDLDLFKRRLGLFEVFDQGFSEILEFEGKLDAVRLLPVNVRIWATAGWYISDRATVKRKMEEKYLSGQEMLLNSITIEGASGELVDPGAYHSQQVRAMGSAIMIEAYRCNWFDGEGLVELPEPVPVKDEDISKAGAVLFNANAWALLDDLQEQVRYLSREVTIRDASQFENPPEGFKFGIEIGPNVPEKFFEYIAAERTATRESSDFFAIKSDANLDVLLQRIAAVCGSEFARDNYIACHSLSTLLNYNIHDDDNEYSGLTLSEWVEAFCGLRDFCAGLVSVPRDMANIISELIEFCRNDLIEYLKRYNLTPQKCEIFVKNMTFHKKSRDLFDTPLLKTPTGYAVLSDTVLSSVVSRAIASNLLSRKDEFKPKGAGLEDKVRNIFLKNGVEAVCFKRRYPEPEGEYEYDVLVLWDEKLFVIECKNRWLSEGRAIAIYNQVKQMKGDVEQVQRLLAGLEMHPDMIEAAFGRRVNFSEVVPCVVNGLPYSLLAPYQDIIFTDISVVSRFFSSRTFTFEQLGASGQSEFLYNQWSSESPSAEDFCKAIRRPIQVEMVSGTIRLRRTEMPLGLSAYITADALDYKDMSSSDYISLVRELGGMAR